MKLRFAPLILAAVSALFACSVSDDDAELYFVGDSEVARWDLPRFFPTLVTHNDGLSGAGISYVESLAGAYRDRAIVVEIGTNDLVLAYADTPAYVTRYVDAIAATAARSVTLLSIFPRDFAGDRAKDNDLILRLNQAIRAEADDAGWTYVDVYFLLLRDGRLNGQYSADGLHLNDYGYEIVSNELKKYLR